MHQNKFTRPCDLEALQDLADTARLIGTEKQAAVLGAAVAELCMLRAELTRRNRIDLERRRGGHITKGMRAQRDQADGLCSDEECTLSGGYAHAGPCEPCSCGLEHAIDECPADKVHAPPKDLRLSDAAAQCGARLSNTQMTFRNSDNSMSRRVTCRGCIAVENKKETR